MSQLVVVCALQSLMFPCVEVTKVYDGDTMTVSIPSLPPVFGQELPIRIRGIDAPEMSSTNACEKAKAEAAKAVVTAMALGKKVKLMNPSRDKYFRIDAQVLVGTTDLATMLLDAKLAVPYDGATKPTIDWCKEP